MEDDNMYQKAEDAKRFEEKKNENKEERFIEEEKNEKEERFVENESVENNNTMEYDILIYDEKTLNFQWIKYSEISIIDPKIENKKDDLLIEKNTKIKDVSNNKRNKEDNFEENKIEYSPQKSSKSKKKKDKKKKKDEEKKINEMKIKMQKEMEEQETKLKMKIELQKEIEEQETKLKKDFLDFPQEEINIKIEEKPELIEEQKKLDEILEDPKNIEVKIKLEEEEKNHILIKQKIEINFHEKAVKELETLIQENESLLKELSNFYDSPEQLINELTPKFTNKDIVLVENKECPALMISIPRNELQLFGFSSYQKSHNVETLTANSENFWKIFIIENEINENNYVEYMNTLINSLNEIHEKIDSRFLKNLKEIEQYKDYVMSKDLPLAENILRFIKWYTTNDYKVINPIFWSLIKAVRIKISYLFNLLILNFQKHLVGLEYEGTVFRGLDMDEDYLKIYRVNSVMIYAALTSTSKNENIARRFPDPKDVPHNNKKVLLVFKLLPIKDQEKRQFYSSLNVENISHYKKEEEVLLFPYQFFKIVSKKEELEDDYHANKNISENSERKKCKRIVIVLKQLEENNIIEQIIAERQKPVPVVKKIEKKEEKLDHTQFEKVIRRRSMQLMQTKEVVNKKIELQNLNNINININDQIYPIIQESDMIKIYQPLEEKDKKIYVLWVGNDFEKTSDNASFIRQFEIRYINIEFICKTSTEEALNFLKSDDGNKLRNKNFKIITNMYRNKDKNPENAGINLIQAVRMLFFRCPILLFVGNIENNLKKLEIEKVYDDLTWITTKIAHLERFINKD